MAAWFFLGSSIMSNAAGAKHDFTVLLSGTVMTRSNGVPISVRVALLAGDPADKSTRGSYGVCLEPEKTNCIFQLSPGYLLTNLAIVNNHQEVTSYLSWQDKLTVCLVKISDPVISDGGKYCGYSIGRPSPWVADHFINLNDYDRWVMAVTNSNENAVTLTSVSAKPDGLTVTATNRLGEQLTFRKLQDGWHAFAGANEIRRLKVSPIDWSVLKIKQEPRVLYTNQMVFKTRTGAAKAMDASLKLEFLDGLYRYQLCETTNADNKLSRPIWDTPVAPGNSLGNYSVVGNGKGDGYYLYWTDTRNRLYLSGITNMWSEAKYLEDPNVGPFSHPKDDLYMRGGVDHIIDLRQFANGERFFKGGGGVASASQENNVLTLTVTNSAGSKFTFSNPDGQWHAYSFWGEIKRLNK